MGFEINASWVYFLAVRNFKNRPNTPNNNATKAAPRPRLKAISSVRKEAGLGGIGEGRTYGVGVGCGVDVTVPVAVGEAVGVALASGVDVGSGVSTV